MRIANIRAGLLLALLVLTTAAVPAQTARGTFAVGPITAAPGTRASGFLEVAAKAGADSGTRIPVTVIHGAKPGPVLALIAGTHGYEYSPIVAMQRFPAKVDPRELAGTVIVVHVANMPSFLGRTIYYSPVDGKNLNRVYPGRTDGTISERVAAMLTREVIDRADYVADLHCGDGNEWLRPYSYWITTGDPGVAAKSKEMALAFGLDHIVLDADRGVDVANSVYTSNTAILRGKPAITAETGGMGRVDDNGADLAEAGAFNLLRHFKMLPGEPKRVEHPVWIDRNEVLRSSADGIFLAKVAPAQYVAKGTVVGVLTDFFGKTVEEVRAPFSGVVLYVVATPPVSKGEPLGMVGRVKTEE